LTDAANQFRVSRLIEQLFEAPASPRVWKNFLSALCGEMSAETVAVLAGEFAPGQPLGLLSHGVEIEGVELERLRFLAEHPGPEALPEGAVFVIPPSSSFAQAELFQAVLAKQGIPPGPGLGLVLARSPQQVRGVLLLMPRDPGWRPTDNDVGLLELLAPYVRRAIRVGLQLNVQRSEADSLLELLDSLTLGVVLLDPKSRVRFANRSAAKALGSTPGAARLGDPVHETEREVRTEALRRLMRAEVLGGGAGEAPAPGPGPALQVFSAPLSWPERDTALAARFATVLFLGDPGASAPDPREALQALYGLTPAEARLARALADGLSIAEAAEALSIQLSTARSVLKSVFAKTGTRRQASLVGLVLAAPGRVRVGPK
jgi:DNA-binding CsgD family transcriptional regulator/PAS domain-containing protein